MTQLEIPLSNLHNGERGIITAIRGHGRRGRGWRLERRLMDLGLTPGTTVTTVKSVPFHGPVEVLVRESRLALGRGMANSIIVEVER